MNRLKLSRSWSKKLLPEGLPYPSSTLVSGPGGSGKPLVGLGFAYDWLNNGGSVIFVPLQYPKTKFIKTSLKKLYNLDADDYPDQIGYIQFDTNLDSWRKDGKRMKANLLKPSVWEESIKKLEKSLDKEGPGTLVFASALNLLLFSPTYKQTILDSLEELIGEKEGKSYLFTVSTSAFREDVRRWEQAADNLMFTKMGDEMQLYLRVEKLIDEKTKNEEVKVNISKETLQDIKKVAEGVRKRKIPKLKKI